MIPLMELQDKTAFGRKDHASLFHGEGIRRNAFKIGREAARRVGQRVLATTLAARRSDGWCSVSLGLFDSGWWAPCATARA